MIRSNEGRMKRSMTFTCLLAALCACTVLDSAAQTAPETQSTTSPVAYVYVSSPSPNSYGLIYGYSASSNGQLTPLTNPTYPAYVSYMALNGAWLFGSDGTNIYSFSIASDGTLSQTAAINATQYNPYDSGGPYDLFLDHTGATLYDGDIYAYGTGDSAYQAFSIDQSTGQLTFLQLGPDGGEIQGAKMSFTGNNKYAYSSGCYEGDPQIFGYQRNSDGTLTSLSINPKIPPASGTGNYYCPYLAAADPNNHVAIALTLFNFLS